MFSFWGNSKNWVNHVRRLVRLAEIFLAQFCNILLEVFAVALIEAREYDWTHESEHGQVERRFQLLISGKSESSRTDLEGDHPAKAAQHCHFRCQHL